MDRTELLNRLYSARNLFNGIFQEKDIMDNICNSYEGFQEEIKSIIAAWKRCRTKWFCKMTNSYVSRSLQMCISFSRLVSMHTHILCYKESAVSLKQSTTILQEPRG